MKKTNLFFCLAFIFNALITNGQLDKETVTLLNYQKYSVAISNLQKKIQQNPKDAQSIFWLGQTYIERNNDIRPLKDDVEKAKVLYQKALHDIPNNPWLLIGMGEVEILEKSKIEDDNYNHRNDNNAEKAALMNSAKQKFEQALTASLIEKGKNKGKPSPDILFAIGRAFSNMSGNIIDHNYVIDKLKLAITMPPVDPEIYNELGISYLRLGPDNGGDAITAFKEAIRLDPKNPKAYLRIARIYASQENKELVDQWTNEAIKADPNFTPTYYVLFDFYEDKDINVAKMNLDKYISLAEKTANTEFIQAQYLFRTAKYNESIIIAKNIETEFGHFKLPKNSLLLALNFQRINDSIQSAIYIDSYLKNTPSDKINPMAFNVAIDVFSQFPGKENLAANFINEAIKIEKTNSGKLKLINRGIKLFDKANMNNEEYQWILKSFAFKSSLSERDYYDVIRVVQSANLISLAMDWSSKYLAAFPASKNAYIFYFNNALALDPDTTSGVALPYLDTLNNVMLSASRDNRTRVSKNIYFSVIFNLRKIDNQIDAIKSLENVAQIDSIAAIIDNYTAKTIEYTNYLELAYADKPDTNITKWTNGTVKTRLDQNKDFIMKTRDRAIKIINQKNNPKRANAEADKPKPNSNK